MKKVNSAHMNGGIRGMALLYVSLLLALCIFPASDAVAAEKKASKGKQYVSIQELYEQTRNGWQGSYIPSKTHGFAPDGYVVNVDVPITVPDVSRFPIVELTIKKDVLKDKTFMPIMKGQTRDDGMLDSSTLPAWDSEEAIHFDEYCYPGVIDGQAEGNPLTAEQAKEIGQRLLQKYFREDNFRIRGVVAYETTPISEKITEGYEEYYPKLDIAPYYLLGEQVFEGIPLLFRNHYDGRYLGVSYFNLTLFSEDVWRLQGGALTQVSVRLNDVPLLPWSEIQQVIERQCIQTGKTLDVYGVNLGYELVLQKKGPSTHAGYTGDRKTYPKGTFDEVCYVRPVWVLNGFHTWPCPPGSATISEPTAVEKLRIFQARRIVIDAQTAEIVYTEQDLKFHNLAPTILTWENVGGNR